MAHMGDPDRPLMTFRDEDTFDQAVIRRQPRQYESVHYSHVTKSPHTILLSHNDKANWFYLFWFVCLFLNSLLINIF